MREYEKRWRSYQRQDGTERVLSAYQWLLHIGSYDRLTGADIILKIFAAFPPPQRGCLAVEACLGVTLIETSSADEPATAAEAPPASRPQNPLIQRDRIQVVCDSVQLLAEDLLQRENHFVCRAFACALGHAMQQDRRLLSQPEAILQLADEIQALARICRVEYDTSVYWWLRPPETYRLARPVSLWDYYNIPHRLRPTFEQETVDLAD